MADRYLKKRLKNNWQTLVIIILCIIFLSIVIKNIGEKPYEDQHLMTSMLPINFEMNNKQVKGFVYLSYWVETEKKNVENLTTDELDDYLYNKGQIKLRPFSSKIISTLKSYSLEEIKKDWYSDMEYFKNRNIYYIENDDKLLNNMQKLDFKIELPYELKKSFFVYLDQSSFAEFMKEIENQ